MVSESQDNDSLTDSGNSSISNSSCSPEDVANLHAFCINLHAFSIKRIIRDVVRPTLKYLANVEKVDGIDFCSTRKWVERSNMSEPLQSRIIAAIPNTANCA